MGKIDFIFHYNTVNKFLEMSNACSLAIKKISKKLKCLLAGQQSDRYPLIFLSGQARSRIGFPFRSLEVSDKQTRVLVIRAGGESLALEADSR